MKTLQLFSIALICSCTALTVSAQKAKTETFQVSGNCGMCETKIEKAAIAAGASTAEWNKDTKVITVKYKSTESNLAKIQKSIADAGYDNAGAKATNDSYDKLHGCCKYERVAATEKTPDCCKDGKCTMPGHDGKDCCKKMSSEKMDCCKDGKCTKEGHDGKDCCKKEEGHNGHH